MKWLKIAGLVLLVVLVGLQFIPTRTNQSSEVPSTDFVKTHETPEEVAGILHASCYNCHSNNTSYPWYSRVQPVGLFLKNHIEKGKDELNLSEFGSYSSRRQLSKLKSMVSQIEDDEMPLPSYTLLHPEARLSQEKKKVLVDYLNALIE